MVSAVIVLGKYIKGKIFKPGTMIHPFLSKSGVMENAEDL